MRPQDVDLLVLQRPEAQQRTTEQLKELLVSIDRQFYLKSARDPQATYKVLWFRSSSGGRHCKVDILIPGIMHLPNLLPKMIRWIDRIPLVPFSVLLLQKLQGWDDHRNMTETHKNQKQHSDAADIRWMLELQSEMAALRGLKPWDDVQLFDKEFQLLSQRRVVEYCAKFPDRDKAWQSLGFETRLTVDTPGTVWVL